MQIEPGATTQIECAVTEEVIQEFADLSGDQNPFHTDEVYAANTFFKSRIAHGALLLSWVSRAIGTELPGPGTILLSLESEFLKPAYIGDTVRTCVVVEEVEGNKAVLGFWCENQGGDHLLKGQARVSVPKT